MASETDWEKAPDGEPLPESFWENAQTRASSQHGQWINLKVDDDVVEHFKSQHGQFKDRILDVLRRHVDQERKLEEPEVDAAE